MALQCGEERRVRTTIAERHPEALRIAQHDVRAELAGRFEEGEAQQVGCYCDEDARCLRALDDRSQIVNETRLVGRLEQNAEDTLTERRSPGIANDELDPKRFGAA